MLKLLIRYVTSISKTGSVNRSGLEDDKNYWTISSIYICILLAFSVFILSYLSIGTNKICFFLDLLIGGSLSLGILLSFLVIPKKIQIKKNLFIFSLLTSIFVAEAHSNVIGEISFLRGEMIYRYTGKIVKLPADSEQIFTYFITIAGSLAVCLLFCFFAYYFYSFVCRMAKLWLTKFDRSEKILFICLSLIYASIIVFAYARTNVFYHPSMLFDLVYTSDTGELYDSNAYMVLTASQNDLRQPLFGLFSAPFCVFPYIVSKIFYFVPDLYAYLIAILQSMFIIVSNLTVSRISVTSKNTLEKSLFTILLSFSFPTLLFMLNMEQYTFALFWLIMFLYFFSEKISCSKKEFLLLAASGSLMTSWIFLPLFAVRHNLRKTIQRFCKLLISFAVLCIAYFKVEVITSAYLQIKDLLSFSSLSGSSMESPDMIHRFYQFTNFVCSCVFAPASHAVKMPASSLINVPHYSYQLLQSTTVNVLGIILLGIAICGFILNKEKLIAKISMFWVLFSVLLLLCIGWGAVENGMVLYTLYFSWAYYVLFYLFCKSIFPKCPYITYCLLSVMLVFQFSINIPAILKIIQFGINYYP